MATWIVHLRVAEKLLTKFNLNKEMFLAGNIGPDSGIPNDDYSEFTPNKKVTHWLNPDLNSSELRGFDSEAFYKKYISNRDIDFNEYSFLIGYFTHLLTDAQWSKMHSEIKSNNKDYADKLASDPSFIWTVKKDWYGLDYKYINDNQDCIYNMVYRNISEIPDYLDYFPKGAFTLQKNNVLDYYTEKNEDFFNKSFTYLTEDMMNSFITTCSEYISNVLLEKKIS